MSGLPRDRSPRRWLVIASGLAIAVASLGLIGQGALGAWQALTENPTNTVIAAAASAVPVTSLHCSGGATPYGSCNDTSGTVTLSWAAVSGSPGITVERATSPAGTYTSIATLAGTATTYTDTTAAYNTQYYYAVFSGPPGWASASAVDMALSLPATGGTDDTAGTGGTAFSGPYTQSGTNLYAMATAGGTTYTTKTAWGSSGTTVVGNQQVNGLSCVTADQCWAVTQSGDIWVTSNGGFGWTEQPPPEPPRSPTSTSSTPATAGWWGRGGSSTPPPTGERPGWSSPTSMTRP